MIGKHVRPEVLPLSGCGCILVTVTGTSVRKFEELNDLSRADKIAALRATMASLGGEVPAQVVSGDDVVEAGDTIAPFLPLRGLPRRAVTHISDTPSLVVEILGNVTAKGGFAGVVGWPELSYAGVENPQRVVAVPDPGAEPLSVVSVLVEGLDVVVYRTASELMLSSVRARPMLGKLRSGHAALVLVGTKVQSPALSISATVDNFHGIGQGSGRIMGLDLNVRTEAKGYRPASGTLSVGTQPVRRLKVVR